MDIFRCGDDGPAVAEIRGILTGLGLLSDDPPLTVFDTTCETAVRVFQQDRGLTVDGIVGPETYRGLTAARWRLGDRVLSRQVSAPLVGDDVAALQERLLELGYDAGRVDGIFGPRTETALLAFQREMGIELDGTCGPATLRALHMLGRKVVGGRPHLLREAEVLHHRGPALFGKRVVIDPGHGGSDQGNVAAGLSEAEIAWDLATRFEGRLVAAGVRTDLTRGRDTGADEPARADFANATGADLLVSVHVDAHPSPAACGLATYHFGTRAGVASSVGERLADLVQREIVARTAMVDGRTHGKAWDLLRLTRMPAIRTEIGYVTSPRDRELLRDPHFRDTVADALLVAVQRVYLGSDADVDTGQLPIPVPTR